MYIHTFKGLFIVYECLPPKTFKVTPQRHPLILALIFVVLSNQSLILQVKGKNMRNTLIHSWGKVG